MSSITLMILLVIFNLAMLNFAYRINPFNKPRMPLFYPSEADVNNNEEAFHLVNFKRTLEKNNYNLQSALIKTQPSRRDTYFLRFGRKS